MATYSSDKAVPPAALARLRAACAFAPASESLLDQQLRGSLWVESAWDGPQLVGFVRAVSDGVTVAYVSSMMVDAAYRRQGIGRELLRRLTAGRDSVRFVLHARDDAAATFYRAAGFSDISGVLRLDRRRLE